MTSTFFANLALCASGYTSATDFVVVTPVGPGAFWSASISFHTGRNGVALNTATERVVTVVTFYGRVDCWALPSCQAFRAHLRIGRVSVPAWDTVDG